MRALRVLAAVSGLGFAGMVAVLPMSMMSTISAATSGGYSCSTPTAPGPALPIAAAPGPVSAVVNGSTVTLDHDQIANAQTIVATGRHLQVPERGWVVAIATALQESTLRNLNWGDRDSIGLFQQRNAWGSRSQRLDPAQSAAMFYTGGHQGQRGLLDISGWQLMPVSVAAQSVQVSAYPTAYAKWETFARRIVASVSGGVVEEPEPSCVLVTPTPSEGPPPARSPGEDVPDLPGVHNGRIPIGTLTVIPWDKGQRLRSDAVAELIPLDAEYKARFGRHLCITDSYRTYDEQVQLYRTKPGLAARPGTSNHGWARALDLCGGLNRAGSAEDAWMHEHAPRYGWRHPAWAEPGGSRPEAWHWSWRTDN